MFQLNLKNRKSIYEQIVDGFKDMIISGELKPGQKIPSVREMSAKLIVNPNTIQKAYRKLESDGWIYTVAGRGAFVSDENHDGDRQQLETVYEQIGALIAELRYLGEGSGEISRRLVQMAEERRGEK